MSSKGLTLAEDQNRRASAAAIAEDKGKFVFDENIDGPVLIWGGTGFIGSHLARAISRSSNVIVLSRTVGQVDGSRSDRIQYIRGCPSKMDRGHLANLIGSCKTIYALAGSSGAVRSNQQPIDDLQANSFEYLCFLEACAQVSNPPHIIFASSRLVYGAPETIPVDELQPLRPASIYAVHKQCIENYLRVYALSGRVAFTICRIANPYGFDETAVAKQYGFINSLVQLGVAGQPLKVFGDGTQIRDYIHISDLVRVLVRCATASSARNEVFNIGSGVGWAIRDVASLIHSQTGAPLTFSPWSAEYLAVESGDYVSDIEKARLLLEYQPRISIEVGIPRTICDYTPRYEGSRFTEHHSFYEASPEHCSSESKLKQSA